jgi:YidC/Oxa1 family membrane protein insertase
MDRRFVLGLLVSLLFVMLWYSVVQPKLFPKPPAPPPVETPETRPAETRAATAPSGPRAASRPAVDAALVQAPVLENEDLRLTFSTQGAVLEKAELKRFRRSPYSDAWLDLLSHHPGLPRGLELRDLGDPDAWIEQRLWRVETGPEGGALTFVLEPGVGGFQGQYRIRKQIRVPAKGTHAEVLLTFEYLGAGSIEKSCRFTPSGGVSLDSDVYGTHDLTGAESLLFQEDPQDGEKIVKVTPVEMSKVEARDGEPRKVQAFNGRRRFAADINSYFGVYCALEQMPARMEAAFVGNVDPAAPNQKLRVTRTRVDLDFKLAADAGKPLEHKLLFYFGPNEAQYVHENLPEGPWADEFSRVYKEALGMFSWIGKGVLFLLRLFHSITGNWGFAIVLLTFVVRLCLFPINRKSQISMVRHSEAMARIKPRLDVLKEKYKNDTKRFLAEQQALLKAEKVPLVPLGGCLPVVLQIPIFYGLFAALRASIELRQAPFLWAADLSQPDHLVRFDRPFANPLSGLCCCAPPGMSDTISGIHLLPILMTVAWFVNQLLMPKPANEDPQLAQQRKMMMFLPIVFGFMMYGYGAGLSLYWLTSSLLGIVESRVIKKWLPARAVKKA